MTVTSLLPTSLLPGFIEADEALEFLYLAIRDPYNRFSVKEAMGRVRSIFNSAGELVRYKIVTDLTAMKFGGVVPFLTDVLRNDESPLIRHEAAFGIGKLGSARDSTPLIDVLKYDRSNMVRHEAAISLAEIGGKDAIQVLETATTDSDPAVASSARFAIQSILLYVHQDLRVANE